MKKLLPLTGIRAIAAIWVVLFHFLPMFSYGFLNPLAQKGYLGVDLFFILSGFIISYVHQQEFVSVSAPNSFRFLVLRCARILPVHYLMLFVFFFFFVFKGLLLKAPISFETAGTMDDFGMNLLNIQGWGFADHNSWNYVAWSVSAEWFAYLMFPLIAPLMLRLKTIPTNIALIFACFGALILFSSAMGLENIGWTFHYALIRVSMEFIAGCALYNIYKQTADHQLGAWSLIQPLVVLIVGCWIKIPDIALVMLMIPIIYGLSKNMGWLARFLSTRPLVHLGDISFSIYMVHAFIYDRLHPLDQKAHFISTEPSISNIVIFSVIMLSILGTAQLVYQFVEVPCRNCIRSFLNITSQTLGVKGKQKWSIAET